MKGICLCSGGLDSTLALLRLLKEGNEVIPMFIDFNQWSLEGEIRAVCQGLEWMGGSGLFGQTLILEPEIFEIRNAQIPSERVGSVWGRNIALVGLAAMWAYTHGNDYEFIALGNHKGDVGPDCKPGQFDISLHGTLIEGTRGQLDLVLPVRKLTVEDIGKELAEFGISWNLMYSCYWYPPCGYKSKNEEYRCPGCRRKTIAMEAGGVKEPVTLHRPNSPEVTYQSPLAEKTEY